MTLPLGAHEPPQPVEQGAFVLGVVDQDVGVDEPINEADFVEGGSSNHVRLTLPKRPDVELRQFDVDHVVDLLKVLVRHGPHLQGVLQCHLLSDLRPYELVGGGDALEAAVVDGDDIEAHVSGLET
eukprot:15912950-Heterocapsa_arctica.AAC.1